MKAWGKGIPGGKEAKATAWRRERAWPWKSSKEVSVRRTVGQGGRQASRGWACHQDIRDDCVSVGTLVIVRKTDQRP